MFSLNRETDYAAQLLKILAKNKVGFVSLRQLAKETGVSFMFLQKIARDLRLAGLIKSEKGVSGGYRLGMPAKKITLKKIIEAMEGEAAVVSCLCQKGGVQCASTGKKCVLKNKLVKVNKKIDEILNKTSLNDL